VLTSGEFVADRVRFGVLGCGVVGPTHAAAIASLPDAELVAVADAAPDRAATLAARHGVRAYGDLTEMLDRERLDVVNVCTPSGMHGAHAIEVMRSGCNVMVEKPMEIRRDAIDEMLSVQKETGTTLAVVFQHRFVPASRQVHALTQEGALGRLVLGNAHDLLWRSQTYYDSGAWRGSWALDGGGALMNQAIHSIDLLQWLMGPVRSVYALTGTLAHEMETEDTAVAVLRFANGALGTILGTTAAYPGVTSRIELFGDKGSAVIENDELGFQRLARDEGDAEPPRFGLPPVPGADRPGHLLGEGVRTNPAALPANSHTAQIADMARAVRDGGTPLVDGSEGRRAVDIILSIYASAGTGKEVVVQ
jgi:predicted dehydrogenase